MLQNLQLNKNKSKANSKEFAIKKPEIQNVVDKRGLTSSTILQKMSKTKQKPSSTFLRMSRENSKRKLFLQKSVETNSTLEKPIMKNYNTINKTADKPLRITLTKQLSEQQSKISTLETLVSLVNEENRQLKDELTTQAQVVTKLTKALVPIIAEKMPIMKSIKLNKSTGTGPDSMAEKIIQC